MELQLKVSILVNGRLYTTIEVLWYSYSWTTAGKSSPVREGNDRFRKYCLIFKSIILSFCLPFILQPICIKSLTMLLPIALLVLDVFGLLTNILSLIVFLTEKKLKTVTNYYQSVSGFFPKMSFTWLLMVADDGVGLICTV